MKSLSVLLRQTMAVALLSLPLESSAGEDRRIALTFDDGQLPGTTGELLDELERLQLKASFFPSCGETVKNPEAIGTAATPAASVDCTGRLELAPPTVLREIAGAAKILRQLGHRDPLALRPAYAQIPRQREPGQDGSALALWNTLPASRADPEAPQQVADYIADNAFPGAVVLVHPIAGQRQQILETLPLLSEQLRKRGYEFATLSEVVAGRKRKTESTDV